MKSTFAILTLFVAATVFTPRQSLGQYAWVPVYTDAAAVEAYNTAPGQTGYATYVGEDTDYIVEDTDVFDDKGGKGDPGCKSGCQCPSCRNAGLISRSFGGVEYLQWWNKGRYLPALISNNVVPPGTVLFGNEDVGKGLNSGLRATVGMWLDDCKNNAVVVRAFGSGGDNTQYGATSGPGAPFLAVPFFDTFTSTPGALAVDAGANSGTITAQAANDILGGDVYFRTLLDQGCDYRFDLLGGVQLARIDDDLVLSTVSDNPFTTNDYFNVANEYTAGELGLLGEFTNDCVTLQVMGKCGVGNMRQTVGITGNSTLAGLPTDGGIFARPSNIGFYSRDVFAWSPEASVRLSRKIRENISVSVGYTFLYFTNVALAGDQVNSRVNSQALFTGTGTDATTFTFRDTDFWIQTIDIGLAVKY